MGTSSAAARIGSMSAPYVVWLVCNLNQTNFIIGGNNIFDRKWRTKNLAERFFYTFL